MKQRTVASGFAVAAVAIALGRLLVVDRPPAAVNPEDKPPRAALAPTGSPATAVVVSGPEAARVGNRMTRQEAVANDIIFLVVAALRGRCVPASAHDLPRMAVLARLPVLSAGTEGDAVAADLRRDITRVVNDVVHQSPCSGPVALQIGTYVRVFDPTAYAGAFPDSYFDPTLTTPPPEFNGVPLDQRVADRCTPLIYAVLTLDDTHPWQCVGMRADTRSSILKLCHVEGASPEQTAADIRNTLDRLPANCR